MAKVKMGEPETGGEVVAEVLVTPAQAILMLIDAIKNALEELPGAATGVDVALGNKITAFEDEFLASPYVQFEDEDDGLDLDGSGGQGPDLVAAPE